MLAVSLIDALGEIVDNVTVSFETAAGCVCLGTCDCTVSVLAGMCGGGA